MTIEVSQWKGTHYCQGCGYDIEPKDNERECTATHGDLCRPVPRTKKKVGKQMASCDQRDEYDRRCTLPINHKVPHAATTDAASSWMRGYEGSADPRPSGARPGAECAGAPRTDWPLLRAAAKAIWENAVQVANDPGLHLVTTSLLLDLDRAGNLAGDDGTWTDSAKTEIAESDSEAKESK